MDYFGAVNELQSIKAELQAVIAALDCAASGILTDFSGISSEKCVSAIETVLADLRLFQRSLNEIGEGAVWCWFEERRRAAEAARIRAEQEEAFTQSRSLPFLSSLGE